MESLLIPNNFDGNNLARLVIQTLAHLSKTPLPKYSEYLISISEMISLHNNVIPNVIIKAKVGHSSAD